MLGKVAKLGTNIENECQAVNSTTDSLHNYFKDLNDRVRANSHAKNSMQTASIANHQGYLTSLEEAADTCADLQEQFNHLR